MNHLPIGWNADMGCVMVNFKRIREESWTTYTKCGFLYPYLIRDKWTQDDRKNLDNQYEMSMQKLTERKLKGEFD
jgi:hypothetical protein